MASLFKKKKKPEEGTGEKKEKKKKSLFKKFKKSKTSSTTEEPKKPEVTGIFGKKLPKNPEELPSFVFEAMNAIESNGLDTEGIFRIAAHQSTLEVVIQQLEKGEKVNLFNVDVHICGTILRRYFRELPDPLLTFEAYDMFIAAEGIPDVDVRKGMIKKVLSFLPAGNYKVLKTMCTFLYKVKENSAKNLMNSGNLAIVFAPNLLRSPRQQTPQEMIKDSKHSNDLMKTLIEQSKYFFEDVEEQPKPIEEVSQVDKDMLATLAPPNMVTTQTTESKSNVIVRTAVRKSLPAVPAAKPVQQQAPVVEEYDDDTSEEGENEGENEDEEEIVEDDE